MKTKTIIFAIIILCSGCEINKPITYYTNDVWTNKSRDLSNATFDIEEFADQRKDDSANKIFYVNENLYLEKGQKTCINAEKYYRSGTVSSQLTEMLAEHLNKRKTFKAVFKNKKDTADYYLSGKLTEFYGKQDYTIASKVGEQFGALGALVAAAVKTNGKIILEITDLKIYNKQHQLVKDLGIYRREYDGNFPADSYCWCIYDNVNAKLKEYFTELVTTIETEIKKIELNEQASKGNK